MARTPSHLDSNDYPGPTGTGRAVASMGRMSRSEVLRRTGSVVGSG